MEAKRGAENRIRGCCGGDGWQANLAKKNPYKVEIVETEEGRAVVVTYGDGEIVRKLVDPSEKPRRKPRKPFARAWSGDRLNKTHRKQI